MLVLGVESGDYIMINDDIVIKVEKTGENFKLAFDAPKKHKIMRSSLYRELKPENALKLEEKLSPKRSFQK